MHSKIIKKFSKAISAFDVNEIELLLAESGQSFEIGFHSKVNKGEFLNWLSNEIENYNKEELRLNLNYEFDICNGCQIGRTVVIFDGGQFPAQKPNALFKYTGWNIEVSEGLITAITFCHSSKKLLENTDYAF